MKSSSRKGGHDPGSAKYERSQIRAGELFRRLLTGRWVASRIAGRIEAIKDSIYGNQLTEARETIKGEVAIKVQKFKGGSKLDFVQSVGGAGGWGKREKEEKVLLVEPTGSLLVS